MGLTLIIMLIVAVITLRDRCEANDKEAPDLLFRLFGSAVICVIILVPLSAYISASSAEEGSSIERRVVDEKTEQLQEFQQGIYIISVLEQSRYNGFDSPKLSIKINDEVQRISLDNSTVYCNASEAKMITRKYKLKNKLLSFLLFDFKRTERELYTPEEMIYGEYDFVEQTK